MKTHSFTRAAALVELDGEVFLLRLSASAWQEVLAIAVRDGGGTLPLTRVPNRGELDSLDRTVH